MGIKSVLRAGDNTELLSYIINSTPELRSEIDLPVQGESIAPIGKLILSNERFKNAFINTINLIGLTVISRNYWENPWESFINRGMLRMGQSVRELFVDIAKVFDYNAYANQPEHFLQNVVPDVLNYIHVVNYQKFYKTTTSDDQMAMAFTEPDGLFNLIETIIGSLYEAYKYDTYIVNKYMLCRRILDGTVTSVEIDNYASLTPRQRVAKMKDVSNKMTFRSPNYNPAGVRVSTAFGDQIMILNTDFEADMTTDVLATSFFRNEAEFKTNLALIDGFNNHDIARLTELLGTDFIPFTEGELTAMGNIPAVIVSREWFQNYNYALDVRSDSMNVTSDGLRATNLFNPETLRNNHWLHVWKVVSTSPFQNAVVFTKDVAPAVSAVDVSPATADTIPGQKVQLSSVVTTTGFANKAVTWSIQSDSEADPSKQATINQSGLLTIPSTHVKKANGTQGVYVVEITTALATGESLTIAGVTYTASAEDNTATKQATSIYALFAGSTDYTVTRDSAALTFTEKSGHYGVGKPVVTLNGTTGVYTETTTTAGVPANTGQIVVKATSVFDTSKNDTATITVK